jgi:hypothetical protein
MEVGMMQLLKASMVWGLIITMTALFACDGGGGGGGEDSTVTAKTGTVSIGLTDSSTDTYQAVYVTINEVQVNRNESGSDQDGSWVVVATPRKTYNLLKLVNGVTETLGEDELAIGVYNQIRLIIGETPESENNMFGEPHPSANYVVLDDGADTIKPLKIPSGINTGIKLVHRFTVREGQVVELLLDFDACRSVVKAGNSGKYILKPTIKVIDTLNKSVVSGLVTDESVLGNPLGGAAVSAQISDGLSATVVRSTLTDLGSDFPDEKGKYELLLSPTQSYNIVAFSNVFFSNETITGSQMYAPACERVDAPWNDAEIDFALTSSGFGTISGEVFLGGEIVDSELAVYVSFYTVLSCGNVNDYVEVATLPLSLESPNDDSIIYSVDLPVGDYDVVASAEGFVPATSQGVIVPQGGTIFVEDLFLSTQAGS